MQLPLTGDTLLQLIPQRAPLIMVSSLEQYEEYALISSFFVQEGHILVTEELTESGLLEHMAQSVALHTGYAYFLRKEKAPTGYIGSMQLVEIFRLPRVGDTVFTDVRIIQEFMGVTLVEIITKLEGEIIATAQMKTVIAR
ncbi:hypothetical protein [Sphingobacterium suaedae]|uniref:FabZ n=1 Tax=Sphingobacterium suaedae TaxID=1686402 RepID=A0ABW5KMV5_9SPHI